MFHDLSDTLDPKNMTKFKKTLLLCSVILFTPGLSVAQTPKQMTTYAHTDYAEYKKTKSTNAAWDDFVKEGFDAIDKENPTAAIEFLRKASNLGCESPLVSFKMAIAYEALGAHYSAIQYYEIAREQFKNTNSEHRYAKDLENNYARALFSMGQVEKAVAILKKTCDQGCDAWALKLLAHQELSNNDIGGASAYIKKLLTHPESGLSPDEKMELTLNIARLEANNGNEANAQNFYKDLMVLDPNNTEAQKYLNLKTKTRSRPKSIPNDSKWEQYDQIFDLLKNK